MASLKSFVVYLLVFFGVLVYTTQGQEGLTQEELTGNWYELGDLKTCKRVPNEPPCNISRSKFVPDYASRQYYKLLEKIYRLARDVSRLDSRPQCTHAYKEFLCAQYFPECKKGQDPRYPNLEISRRIKHDPNIASKCSKVIASCNSFVGEKFVGDRYFLCDHVENYPPDGWELNRCVKYDEESRCRSTQRELPAWLRDHHDQEVQQFMNLTIFRVNHTLPTFCRIRIENFLCRHPICFNDKLLTNYTRQRCSNELECARFVPGEINVDAICLTFPNTSSFFMSSLVLTFITILFAICVV